MPIVYCEKCPIVACCQVRGARATQLLSDYVLVSKIDILPDIHPKLKEAHEKMKKVTKNCPLRKAHDWFVNQ